MYGSLAALTLVVATAAAFGAAASGDDALQPFLGTWVGGLYAVGLAGVGLAVFGLGLPGLAGSATAILAVGFVVFDLLGSSMGLSPDLLALSLTRHLGQPMAGVYDWPGMLSMAAIAIGGLPVGAWGLGRRDLST
jgi:putative exporter of polyketide antibiotics